MGYAYYLFIIYFILNFTIAFLKFIAFLKMQINARKVPRFLLHFTTAFINLLNFQ